LEKTGWKVVEIITPEYSTGWPRVFTKILNKIRRRKESNTGSEHVKSLNNKKAIVVVFFNLFKLISFPFRKFQEKILRGNELFIVAQRKI